MQHTCVRRKRHSDSTLLRTRALNLQKMPKSLATSNPTHQRCKPQRCNFSYDVYPHNQFACRGMLVAILDNKQTALEKPRKSQIGKCQGNESTNENSCCDSNSKSLQMRLATTGPRRHKRSVTPERNLRENSVQPL